MPFFHARIIGVPAPQGSKSFKGMRRGKGGQPVPVLLESSKKVAPWREAVALQVANELQRSPAFFDGAVRLTLQFIMPRTGAEPKGWTRHHTKAPDLSKLIRSTEDAITTAGAWRDDCVVVETAAIKVTAEPGEPTGCCLTIEALPEKVKPNVEKKPKQRKPPKPGANAGRGSRAARGRLQEQPALAI
jgi:crossover junction endodeoxyribonuclease RusA